MANDYDMPRKLEDECSKLKKELQHDQEEKKRLRIEISKLKKELKDIKADKVSGRIKELSGQIAEQEKVNITLHDTIYTIEQEKKQIVQSKGMVSQSEYEGLLNS